MLDLLLVTCAVCGLFGIAGYVGECLTRKAKR